MNPAIQTWGVRSLGPADTELLRTFVAHEAVVPVRSRADLERRLAPDRRLFALLAPEGTPVGFLHVALSERFPSTLESVLSGAVEQGSPRFATFYGVTRVGERARGRGGELIGAAAAHLRGELSSLETFATLSPMPGFRSWLEAELLRLGRRACTSEIEALARRSGAGLAPAPAVGVLQSLACAYLSRLDGRGRVLDPVARFHQRNGASVQRILVGADCSWHGLDQSFGTMASYQYAPQRPGIDCLRRPADLDAALLGLTGEREAA